MSAQIIDGKAVAAAIRAQIKIRADALIAQEGVRPGLAVILVGDNAASRIYVRSKARACEEVGFRSAVHELPAHACLSEVLALVEELNADSKVHGILLQLPLPPQIDSAAIMEAIDRNKDVDGFNRYNMGALLAGQPIFAPCTPKGVMRLLAHYEIALASLHAVVIGRSNIVGKPLALMLLAADATVSICTSKTHNLSEMTILADVLIAAAGRPHLVTANMVKPGAVVIDVGINRLADARLVGDVDFNAVKARASYITPVPGGVGPMTIAMLLENTLAAAERHVK